MTESAGAGPGVAVDPDFEVGWLAECLRARAAVLGRHFVSRDMRYCRYEKNGFNEKRRSRRLGARS